MAKIIGSAALAPGGDSGTDLTTKGDLHGYSSENTRIPISTNNFSLLADSGTALGLKWAASPTSILSAQSDLLYARSANTLARLAKGAAGTVLTMNAGATAPSWAAPSGGSLEQLDILSLGSAGSNLAITPSSAYEADDYSYFIIKGAMGTVDGGESVRFRINNKSDSNYQSNMILNTAGTLSATTEDAQNSALIVTSGVAVAANGTFQFVMNLLFSPQNATNTFRPVWSISDTWDQEGSSPSDTQQSTGFFHQNSITELNKIDFFLSGGSNFTAGSNIRLYGVTKT